MSRTRMGVPATFATMMSSNWSTAPIRPRVRTPSSVSAREMRPPGTSTFSSRIARSTSVIVRLCACSLSASTNTRTWRSRAPVIETSPTPSTVSRTRLTCLSAISLVSRRLRGLATTTATTESESGSAFWITGGRMFGGRARSAPETFSRTSWAASAMSRSRTKRAVMRVVPSVVITWSSSRPDSAAGGASSGITTCVVTSSGVAPGRRIVMLTVAGSALGKRSTPRSRKEKTPSVVRNATSITVNTGRLTQSSTRPIGLLRGLHGSTVHGLLALEGNGDLLPILQPLDDLDLLAISLAELDLLLLQRLSVHRVHLVDAEDVAHGVVGDGEDALDLPGGDRGPREEPRLQHAVFVLQERLELERAGLRVHRRAHARDRAGERAPGGRLDRDGHRLPHRSPA